MATLSNIPQPPLDAVMPPAQTTITVIFAILALVSLVYTIFVSLRTKSALPLAIFVGCTLSMYCEAIVTYLGHCWYPAIGQMTLYETMDHKIPWFAGLAYCFYFAPGIIYLVDAFEKGMSTRTFWVFLAVTAAFVVGYDYLGISLGLWLYYGETPLTVAGFPFWWVPANLMVFVPAAIVIYLAKPYLTGWRTALIVPFMAAQVLMFHGLASLPMYSALNSSAGHGLRTLAVVMTFGISLATMWVSARIACRDEASVAREAMTLGVSAQAAG
ncbi:MAG: hypothetical protein ABW034_19925 [Steroidobacteraceae bacterium]